MLESAVSGWPLAALTLATAMVCGGWVQVRRRCALNRALHELRRPLQTVYLASRRGPGAAGPALPSSLAIVSAALNDLDREINGAALGRLLPVRAEVTTAAPPPRADCFGLLRQAEARWRARVAVAGGSIQLRWRAGRAVLVRDPARVAQAVDNLIANAVEHGGAVVTIDASRARDSVRIAVCDRGTGGEAAGGGPATPASVIARLTGRRRRGHGLTVVRSVAASQGGRFFLRPSPWGSRAVLELPAEEPSGAVPA